MFYGSKTTLKGGDNMKKDVRIEKHDGIDFDKLSPRDRACTVSVSRLISHLRGLEKAGVLKEEDAGKLIGAVRILEALAKGTFKERFENKTVRIVEEKKSPVVLSQ